MFCSWRPQPPSPRNEDAECLLAGMKMQSAFWIGLRSPGRKVNIESLCAPRDQPEKEREGEEEREKERERKND